MNAWKPITAACIIFAAGVLTGGLTVSLRQASTPTSQTNPATPSPTYKGPTNRLDGPLPLRPANPAAAEAQLRDLSQRMGRFLNLSREQRDRIHLILNETQDHMRALADEVAPRTRDELRQMRERIRSELTPEQRRKFETMFRNRENRLRRQEPGTNAPASPTNP